jgi:hypothetical protein
MLIMLHVPFTPCHRAILKSVARPPPPPPPPLLAFQFYTTAYITSYYKWTRLEKYNTHAYMEILVELTRIMLGGNSMNYIVFLY